MTNKLKIKLTKEHFLKIQKTECSPNYCDHDFIIEIDESQIVREKSNVDKWAEVLVKLDDQLSRYQDQGELLDRLGYNADVAYNEVVGDE